MIERIQVALKVDNTSLLFKDVIKPRKDDNQLSSFILDLIKAYADDEAFRSAFYAYRNRKGDIAQVQEQLNRILLAHSRTIAKTAVAEQYVESTISPTDDEYAGSGVNVPAEEDETQMTLLKLSNQLGELKKEIQQFEPLKILLTQFPAPLGGAPASSVPLGGAPASSVPLGGAPASSAPLGGAPASSVPLGGAPASSALTSNNSPISDGAELNALEYMPTVVKDVQVESRTKEQETKRVPTAFAKLARSF